MRERVIKDDSVIGGLNNRKDESAINRDVESYGWRRYGVKGRIRVQFEHTKDGLSFRHPVEDA